MVPVITVRLVYHQCPWVIILQALVLRRSLVAPVHHRIHMFYLRSLYQKLRMQHHLKVIWLFSLFYFISKQRSLYIKRLNLLNSIFKNIQLLRSIRIRIYTALNITSIHTCLEFHLYLRQHRWIRFLNRIKNLILMEVNLLLLILVLVQVPISTHRLYFRPR